MPRVRASPSFPLASIALSGDASSVQGLEEQIACLMLFRGTHSYSESGKH